MGTDATELNIEQPEALLAYLRRTGRIDPDERPALRPLPGGVSNRTVRVERSSGEAWVLKQALAKLRVAVEWCSDPARIHVEANGLRWLAKLTPPGSVPGFVFEDRERHVLAMEAVPEPHDNWKTLLLEGRLEQRHVLAFGRLLGAIHREAWKRRAEVARDFEDRSFFESLRLEPYYAYAATQVPAAAAFLHTLVGETRAVSLTLVHGDYSPKNVLVRENRLILLDHEVLHFGDPAFDLGFSLTHFLSKAHHLVAHRAAFAAAAREYAAAYREALGDLEWVAGLEPRAVRHTLGCLLARVAGRSPLEYLDESERARQREAVVRLMSSPPRAIAALVDRFVGELG